MQREAQKEEEAMPYSIQVAYARLLTLGRVTHILNVAQSGDRY